MSLFIINDSHPEPKDDAECLHDTLDCCVCGNRMTVIDRHHYIYIPGSLNAIIICCKKDLGFALQNPAMYAERLLRRRRILGTSGWTTSTFEFYTSASVPYCTGINYVYPDYGYCTSTDD